MYVLAVVSPFFYRRVCVYAFVCGRLKNLKDAKRVAGGGGGEGEGGKGEEEGEGKEGEEVGAYLLVGVFVCLFSFFVVALGCLRA